ARPRGLAAAEDRGQVGGADVAAEACARRQGGVDVAGGDGLVRWPLAGEAVVAGCALARHPLLAEVVADSRVPARAQLRVGEDLGEPRVGVSLRLGILAGEGSL